MTFDYSVVMWTTAALRDNTNLLGAALGWGSENFIVPLSSNGQLPATHYGMHTMARQDFLDTLSAAQGGTLPVVDALTPGQVAEVVASLVYSVKPIGEMRPVEHFETTVSPLMRVLDGQL